MMTVKSLIDRLIDNWPAKVICFALAVLLFLFHQMSSLERKYYSVPLKVYADGELMPASAYPRVVRVSIRGEPDGISNILENDIVAFIDLNYLTEPGTYSVPVQIQLSSSAVSVNPLEVQVEPQEIPINLEKRMIAFVPVTPSFSGDPARGYEVSGYTVNPATVEIAGPRSVIEKVSEVFSDSIPLANRTSSFVVTSAILNHNTLVSLRGDTSAKFSVTVVPRLITRTFVNLPVYCKDLSAEFTESAQKIPLAVTVEGPMLQLESFSFSLADISVDCSKIHAPGEYTLPVSIKVPESFKITQVEPASVTVVITESSNDSPRPLPMGRQ